MPAKPYWPRRRRRRTKARKFLRRNQAAVIAASLVTASLVLGLVGTTWFAVAAKREAGRATTAAGLAQERLVESNRQRDVADARRAEAETANAITQQVNDFFDVMLAAAEPETAVRGS
jgi:uncharacterized iron-regulated membrane protein